MDWLSNILAKDVPSHNGVIKMSSNLNEAIAYKTELMKTNKWFNANYLISDIIKTAIGLLYNSYKKYFETKFGISWLSAKRNIQLITHGQDEAIKIINKLDQRDFETEVREKCIVGIGPYAAYSPVSWKASNGTIVSGSPNGWNGSYHAAQYEEEEVYVVACDMDYSKSMQAMQEYEDKYLVDVNAHRWKMRNMVRNGD